jgi:hypothetical protein
MICGYRFCDKEVKLGRKYCCLLCCNRELGLSNRKFKETRFCARDGCSITIDGKDNRQQYCGQSCAAKVLNSKNNTQGNKYRVCTTCPCPIEGKAKFCKPCKSKRFSMLRSADYSLITLKQLRENYTLSEYHAKLRGNSRAVYKLSGRPNICSICSYSKHVDICHIKPIADFTEDVVISEVNSLNNLITLCKNHHWEFDNDLLDEDSNAILRSGISLVS